MLFRASVKPPPKPTVSFTVFNLLRPIDEWRCCLQSSDHPKKVGGADGCDRNHQQAQNDHHERDESEWVDVPHG
ncbi:hypothetical protein COLSTE_02186 [Collinsella stercoris DSM 13279]|uniref:Uncharacterized protein n=1 Tax=Collinsella stercoris DSM 13279 TaxID=445975 RepID=B6GDK6_9ACTN|nr:hypothetical protein COLSTE_02186 [Collinsella stercoris DSM 13279]